MQKNAKSPLVVARLKKYPRTGIDASNNYTMIKFQAKGRNVTVSHKTKEMSEALQKEFLKEYLMNHEFVFV